MNSISNEQDKRISKEEINVTFQGQLKHIVRQPLTNITVGIIKDKYDDNLYWGSNDGFLFIFNYLIYKSETQIEIVKNDKNEEIEEMNNQEGETRWKEQYCKQIKMSEYQVFNIVPLKDFIALSYFNNSVNILNKKTHQIIFILRGDILVHQGISFLCKSNKNELIIRQDNPDGIRVWKVNKLFHKSACVKQLFSTQQEYNQLFFYMQTYKRSILYYGNNTGTINAVSLSTGKLILSFPHIFKNKIINLTKNSKSEQSRILVGVDSKWNFKIFSLPHLEVVSQFNVFNLAFTTPSFHQILNILVFVSPDTLLISGNSKQAILFNWTQLKTIKIITCQNRNFNSFVQFSPNNSVILLKQIISGHSQFLISEWD